MTRHEYLASGARLTAARGSELPQAKMDEAAVAEARRLHARKQRLIAKINERYSIEALAERYGVAKHTMTKILTRETWAHVREG